MKPKRHKGHGSGTLIASLEALLSKTTSLEIFQSLKSLLIDLSQVSLGLPLHLYIIDTFQNPTTHRGLMRPPLDMSKPSQLSSSSIGATPSLSRITLFRTLSLLVCLHNHRNIRISATLSCWTCRLCRRKYIQQGHLDVQMSWVTMLIIHGVLFYRYAQQPVKQYATIKY